MKRGEISWAVTCRAVAALFTFILMIAMLIAASPSAVDAQAPATELQITLKHDSERERTTADRLRRLVSKPDVRRWIFTWSVLVDEEAIPHSHPVLTLHTRHLDDDDALLAAFLHEQFHWLEEGKANFRAAMRAFAEIYPNAPWGPPEGARDRESTYRHLVVCDLEYQAMTILVGKTRAGEILRANRHYTWIYDRVLNDPRVREVNVRHRLVVDGGR